jgi:hypothetical protein
MNYLRHYIKLIRKCENREAPEGYVERHHIFPKSIYGENDRLVAMTAREHYIAHALLERIFIHRYGIKDARTYKMISAHLKMIARAAYCNSHLYEAARINFSISQTGTKFTQERKNKISISQMGNQKWLGCA